MNALPPILKKGNFFYGWVMLAVCFFINAVTGGAVYSFGVFFKPMIDEFGWPRGISSIGFSAMWIVAGLLGPLVGTLIVRFGLRGVMTAGSLLLTLSFLLLSQVTNLWHFYLVYGLLTGIGFSFAAFVPVMALINNWFIRRRSLAFGITMAGVGFGTVIAAPSVRYAIDTLGWRAAWLFLGGAAFLLCFLPSVLLIKTRPEDIGQLPDGRPPAVVNVTPRREIVYNTPTDWETKPALSTSSLWLITILECSTVFTLNLLAVHQVSHLEDIGIAPMLAAGALGLSVGTSSVGRVLGGILGDRIEPRYIAPVGCTLQVTGLLLLLNARSLGLIYAYVLLYGVAYGALLVLPSVMAGAYFGRRNYARIRGIASIPSNVVSALSPMLAGFFYDAFKSYFIPIISAAVFCAIGGLCGFLARPPSPPKATRH